MTDDTNTVDINTDLDSFSAAYFGTEAPEAGDTDADAVATDEDTDAPAETGDEDSPNEEADVESDAEEQDEDEDEPQPKKNRKSAQERINEITKKAREAERANAALLARLEALETRERNSNQKPIQEALPPSAPKPDAVDDKGNPVYPLGEFDPNFVTDLVKFSNEQAKVELRQEIERQSQEKQQQAAQTELQNNWAAKLVEAEKEIPDLREHIAELTDVFSNINPQYGEYLATTVMQSENGPMIMEYLSQNIDEAQKIIASGPHGAVFAIGKLDAKFAKPVEEKPAKKTSNAPQPPARVTKGTKGATSVDPFTDDLDAFSGLFYSK